MYLPISLKPCSPLLSLNSNYLPVSLFGFLRQFLLPKLAPSPLPLCSSPHPTPPNPDPKPAHPAFFYSTLHQRHMISRHTRSGRSTPQLLVFTPHQQVEKQAENKAMQILKLFTKSISSCALLQKKTHSSMVGRDCSTSAAHQFPAGCGHQSAGQSRSAEYLRPRQHNCNAATRNIQICS